MSSRWLWWLCAFSIVCMVSFGLYSWLGSKDKQERQRDKQGVANPSPVPVREKTVAVPIRKDTVTESSSRAARRFYERARAFHKTRRLVEAKQWYQKALEADPGYVDALNNLGAILMNEKDYDAARNNFEQAVRISPEAVDPNYNLACVYALKGNVGKALSSLKRAATLNPDVKQWAKADPDLITLRGHPEFDALVGTDHPKEVRSDTHKSSVP